MNSLVSRLFDDREQLDQKLAEAAAKLLSAAIKTAGSATLVVSGGSTPLNFFRLLSRKQLAWEKVTILLADERWLPPTHDDSNARLVRNNLLINAAAAARFIPLTTPCEDPEKAEAELDEKLAGLGQFDLVVLGMGKDGHTASLFPDAPNVSEGLDEASSRQCIAVFPRAAPHRRMSMTLPRLLNSRQIFVHITGYEKQQVLEQARKENNPLILPIAAVINQKTTPVTIYFAP